MDEKKRQQLAELRKDRTRVIAGLREQLNRLRVSDEVLLLAALVGLQESQDLLDRWEESEKSASLVKEQEAANATTA